MKKNKRKRAVNAITGKALAKTKTMEPFFATVAIIRIDLLFESDFSVSSTAVGMLRCGG